MRILTVSNIDGINYDDINEIFISMENEYDTILFFDNIDIDIKEYILHKLYINSVDKKIIDLSLENKVNLDYLNIEFIHLKPLSCYDEIILGIGNDNIENFDIDTLPSCDILITHSNPLGVHEHIIYLGCEKILSYIERSIPKLCIHGNQNIKSFSMIGETCIISVDGVSIIDTKDYSVIDCY